MEDLHNFLLWFGLANLCLLLFCRQLSGIVLGFFAFGRIVNPPEELEKQAARIGFQGFFANKKLQNPSRKDATRTLALIGGANFLGCLAFYLLIPTQSPEDKNKANKAEMATPRKPSD